MFKKTKYFLIGGFIFAWLVFLFAPVFAYESNDIAYDIFYVNPDYPNQSTERFIIYDGASPFSNDYLNIADTSIVGYSLNNLVPYYADGDHVSLFVSFGVIIPSSNFDPLPSGSAFGDYSVYISPNYGTDRLTIGSLYGSALFDLRQYRQYQSAKIGGSCSWQGMSCEYKGLIYHGLSASFYGSASVDYDFFNINLQLDLNLTQSNELKPLNIFVGKKWVDNPSGYIPIFRIQSRPFLKINDTSMYGLLQDIESAISNIDFSGLEGLSNLSSQVQNIYNVVHENSIIQESYYNEILGSDETDSDITKWGEQASKFESEVSNLSNIEESLIGTISDFTFPSAPQSTANMNIVGMFFSNELVIALALAFLTMTVAMLFLF